MPKRRGWWTPQQLDPWLPLWEPCQTLSTPLFAHPRFYKDCKCPAHFKAIWEMTKAGETSQRRDWSLSSKCTPSPRAVRPALRPPKEVPSPCCRGLSSGLFRKQHLFTTAQPSLELPLCQWEGGEESSGHMGLPGGTHTRGAGQGKPWPGSFLLLHPTPWWGGLGPQPELQWIWDLTSQWPRWRLHIPYHMFAFIWHIRMCSSDCQPGS